MIYWILFLSLIYCIISLYEKNRNKRLLLFLIIFIAVYFATFRDGLGMDYSTYKFHCENSSVGSINWLLAEPFPQFIYNFCYNTKYSAVIFFFITSALICGISFWVYSRFNNFWLSAFVFITYTNLYISSFNLVRQYVASSIILLGTYLFVIKKKSPWFFLFVLLAFLWHKSAIICVFIYLISDRKFNSYIWIALLLLSWLLPIDLILKIPYLGDALEIFNYTDYLSYNNESYSRTSLVNLYMHFMVLYFIIKNKNLKNREIIENNGFYMALKLTIISIIFSNISANSLPFAYRFAMFFSPFIPLLFSFLPKVSNNKTSIVLVVIPIIVLLMVFLTLNINERIYCPQRILPIESIYDKYYKPFENPYWVPTN